METKQQINFLLRISANRPLNNSALVYGMRGQRLLSEGRSLSERNDDVFLNVRSESWVTCVERHET